MLINSVKDYLNYKSTLEDNNLKSYLSVNMSRELMRNLVNTYLEDWKLYNPSPDTENYMSGKRQEDATNYIVKKIMTNMTDTIRFQLSIAYNVDTDEDLIRSILEVAKKTVIAYSVNQNVNINMGKIPNINAF